MVFAAACTRKTDSTTSAAPAVVTPKEITQCLEEACGPARQSEAGSNLLERPGVDLEPRRVWQTEFAPQLARLVEIEARNDANRMQRLTDALTRKVEFPKDQPYRALIAFFKVLTPVEKSLATLLDIPVWPEKAKLNPDAVNNYLLSVPEVERLASRIMIEKVMLPLLEVSAAERVDPLINPLTQRLRRKYPGVDLRDAQIKDTLQYLSEGERLRGILGPMLGATILGERETPLMDKAKTGGDLEKIEAEQYLDMVANQFMFAAIYDGGENYAAFMNVPLDFEDEMAKLKESDFAAKGLSEVLNRDLKARAQKVTDYCLPRLAYAVALNASGLRRKRALEMVENIKVAATKVAMQYFDPDRREAARAYIAKLEFSLPDTNEENYERIRSAFAAVERSAKRGEYLQKNSGPETDQLTVVGALMDGGFLTKSGNKEPDVYGDQSVIKDACDKLSLHTISDFTLTSLGKISLSWFSAGYPESGVGIIAHEIGHAISKLARNQQIANDGNKAFSESLTCVAKRNPFFTGRVERLSQNWNSYWSEEDWADHFSSKVLTQMAADGDPWASPRNYACTLVKNSEGAYHDETLAPAIDDTHSSGALRLLMIGYDRENLPQSCRKILDIQAAGRPLTCN
ncbi:MAG: hypothetical protein ACXVA9_08730 [Bdellovibrionales bacterium]